MHIIIMILKLLKMTRIPTLVISLILSFAIYFGIQVMVPQHSEAVKILTVGDFGCGSNAKNTVNNIEDKDPELVLALGDYSYKSTAKCWFDIIKPIDKETEINIGNHDDDTKKLLNSYLDHFDLSKQYYSFNRGNIHVLTMATQLDYKEGSKQFDFVKNDLQKASKNSKIKWIIVNLHRPIYTSPNSCSASSCEGSKTLRDDYHRTLFDKYDVDLVLAGHVHNYQRSFPIKYNDDNPSKPTITSSNKHNYNNPEGQIFAIVGTGGINFHGLDDKSSFIASQQAKRFGALELKTTSTKLVGKFFGNDGSVRDDFTITKGSSSSALIVDPFAVQ
jgi:predicted phosphodiesterase